MGFKISQNGINLIKKFEGCELQAYLCPAGVWTIGYGHTAGVYSGMKITVAKAEAYLKEDLVEFESSVNNLVKVQITQNMFDALVSFAFNLGSGSLKNSTLLVQLNKGNVQKAANEFDKWVYADGQVLPGLVERRAAEKKLFLTGSNVTVTPSSNTSSGNSTIKSFQKWLNNNYSAGLTVDGYYGQATHKAATKAYQRVLGVTADGIFGSASKAAVKTLKSGSSGNAVRLMQGLIYCKGYDPNGVDGIYGSGTVAAVKKFQKAKGLTVDGIAGRNTMYALYK